MTSASRSNSPARGVGSVPAGAACRRWVVGNAAGVTVSTIAVLARQAAAGGVPGASTADNPIAAWHEMEDRLDAVDVVFEAQREVDEALAERRGPGGMTRSEVEAQFAALEQSSAAEPASARGAELDEELTALKKKYRV